jgi:hypothetical protein
MAGETEARWVERPVDVETARDVDRAVRSAA